MTTTVAGVTVQNTVKWREDLGSRNRAFSSIKKYKKELLGIKTQMTGLGNIKIKVDGLKEAKKQLSAIRQEAQRIRPTTTAPRAPSTPTQPSTPRTTRSPITDEDRARRSRERMSDKISVFENTKAFRSANRERREGIRLQLREISNERELRVAVSRVQRELRDEAGRRAEILRLQRQSGFAQSRANDSAKHMVGTLFSVYTAVEGISAVVRTGMDFQKVESGMLAVSNNSEEAKANLQFMREETRRLGGDLVQNSKGFMQMLAAGDGKISLKDMKALTTGVLEASTVLGLSTDDQAGSVRALVQMLGKSQVMSKTLDL